MELFQHPFPSRNDFDGLPVLLNNLFIMMSYDEEIVAFCHRTCLYYSIHLSLPSCCFLHFPTYLIQCFHLLFLLHYEVAFLITRIISDFIKWMEVAMQV